MIVSYFSDIGVAYPEDLRSLRRIFDDLCAENHIPRGCITAEDLAKATMVLFASGVTDEDEIRVSLQRFLRQRALAA